MLGRERVIMDLTVESHFNVYPYLPLCDRPTFYNQILEVWRRPSGRAVQSVYPIQWESLGCVFESGSFLPFFFFFLAGLSLT